MKALFISHPDFAELTPLNVFRKEFPKLENPYHPEELKNRHILYRREFSVSAFGRATLRISADDYYKLYINGRFVTMGPAASYPHCYCYNELDVSEYLVEGRNVIAVHNYYQGLVNRVWVSGDLRQMLWCELDLDGETVLVTDESWKCADHTGYSAMGVIGYETAFTERYDSRAPECDFLLPDFDDSSWGYAKEKRHSDYTLVKQSTRQLDIYDIEPEQIISTDYGCFVDFGREAVGYMSVTAQGECGSEIELYYGEELTEEGRVRYDMRCNCVYHESWVLSGGVDTLNNFDYKAFRYAEIHIPSGARIEKISFTVRHYPFAVKTEYDLSDERMRKIIKLCTDTVKYGTQENYVDCPTREKGQYLGDVSIAARAQAIVTGDPTLMKKAVTDFCNSAFICPGIMTVSGSSFMQEIADYSLQFSAQVLWLYRFDKDIEFLKFCEPYLTGAYKYFLGFVDERGLIHNQTEKWNMVDWPANLRDGYDFPLDIPIGEGFHNVINAFWIGYIKALDEIYSILGMPKTGMLDRVTEAYRSAFYCPELGLFCDSEAHTHAAIQSNVVPLVFGVCDGDGELVDRIVGMIKEKRLNSMGTYMSYFALCALVQHGRRELALELTVDGGCWLNMINEGATTAFEAWGKEQKWNTSLFHPWSVAPLVIFNKDYIIY